MEYTKGKWEVGSDSWDTYIGTGTQYLAKIINSGSLTDNEVQANAHLIAAAPEMYEALKLLIERMNSDMVGSEYGVALTLPRVWAERALAKAEGKNG